MPDPVEEIEREREMVMPNARQASPSRFMCRRAPSPSSSSSSWPRPVDRARKMAQAGFESPFEDELDTPAFLRKRTTGGDDLDAPPFMRRGNN